MKIETKEILKDCIRVTTTDERWYLKDKDIYTSSTWISSYVPSKELAIWMAKKGWDEAEMVKREAGARGSRVHKGCEILGSGGVVHHNDSFSDGEGDTQELTAEEYEGILSFKDWCNEVNPKFLATEKTVFNKKYMYAGTLDAIVEIDGVVWLVDYKTSARIYPSHEVQLASYFYADGVQEKDKAQKMGILQLNVKANKYKKWRFTEVEERHFAGFLHAKYFWEEANANVKPKQKDYPLKIEGVK